MEKKLSQKKIGSILQYIMLVTNMLVGIMFTPFIVRNLGKAEYGLYQLVASFAGYLGILDFGIGTTLARYVVKFRSQNKRDEEENYLFMSFVQTSLFSLAVLLIGCVLYFFLDDIFSNSLTIDELAKAKVLYVLMVVNISLTLLDHYFWGVHIASEQFIYNTGEKIIRILLRMVCIYILLSNGLGSVALIIVDLSLTVLMLVCDVIYSFVKLKVRIKYHKWDKPLFVESFTFALFIFLQAIINQVTMNTDKFILGIMTSTSIVAIYAVAMQVFSIYNSLSTAIQSVFLPSATKIVHSNANDEEITDFVIRPARIQFMILGLALVGFITIGRDFIICWMGNDFLDAYYISLIIMIPSTIELTENVIVSVVLAKNKNGFRTFAMAGISMFNIVATVILIKMIGYMGAPIATALAYLVGHIIIMNIYYVRIIKINVVRFAKNVLRGTWLALVITLITTNLILMFTEMSGWEGFITKSLFICSVYTVCMIVFGFNKGEKANLNDILLRFRK